MYKEFFIPNLIRPLLTTYAMSHTIVTGLFSIALLAALSQTMLDLPVEAYYFALANWGLFNVFEFSRKTLPAVRSERAWSRTLWCGAGMGQSPWCWPWASFQRFSSFRWV